MDPIRWLERPAIRRPQALLAFEGWSDACDAASGGAAYLLGQADAEPFAVIEPEEFIDFQVNRPTVEVEEGGTRSLSWPTTRVYCLSTAADRDLIVALGPEPNLRWKTFARSLTQVFSEVRVERLVTLGAFVGQVPHTVPVPIVGVATDPALVARHGLLGSRYQGPTGIISAVLEACREEGIATVSLWAATPHYLAANPNPRAMAALLDKAGEVLEVGFDTAELEKAAGEFMARVDAATQSSEDLTTMVRRLEEGLVGEELSLGETDPSEMVREIEEFLRDH